jgi:hypothetical protein
MGDYTYELIAWEDVTCLENAGEELGNLQYDMESDYANAVFGRYPESHDIDFITNDYAHDADAIEAEYGSDNEDQFVRKPLSLVDDRDDLKRRVIGNHQFNLRLQLKKGKDDDPKWDISPDLVDNEEEEIEPELQGSGSIDWSEDYPGEAIKYKKNRTSMGGFHVKFTEKGTRSYGHYVEIDEDSAELKYRRDWLEPEGIFFPWFDTSDTDNFKVTEEPRYDADAYEGPIVRLLAKKAKVEVHLIPRPWAYYAHEMSADELGTNEYHDEDGSVLLSVVCSNVGEYNPPGRGACYYNFEQVSGGTGDTAPCHTRIKATRTDEGTPKPDLFPWRAVSFSGCISRQYGTECEQWQLFWETSISSGLLGPHPWDPFDVTPPTEPDMGCPGHAYPPSGLVGYWFCTEHHTKQAEEDCIENCGAYTVTYQMRAYRRNFDHKIGLWYGRWPNTFRISQPSRGLDYEEEEEFLVKIIGSNDRYMDWFYQGTPYYELEYEHTYNPTGQHLELVLDTSKDTAESNASAAGMSQEQQDDITGGYNGLHVLGSEFGTFWIIRKGEEYPYEQRDHHLVPLSIHDCKPKIQRNPSEDEGRIPGTLVDFRDLWLKIKNSPVWSEHVDFDTRDFYFKYEKPFGVGLCPCKAGRLLAMLKVGSRVFYVWRKTDEQFDYFHTTDPETYEGCELGFEDHRSYGDVPYMREAHEQQDIWPLGFCMQTQTSDSLRKITKIGRTPTVNWTDTPCETYGQYVDQRRKHWLEGFGNLELGEAEFTLDCPVYVMAAFDYVDTEKESGEPDSNVLYKRPYVFWDFSETDRTSWS